MMQVESTTAPPDDWDAYVERHPSASAYHRAAAVGVGTAAFGLTTRFLTVRDLQRRLTGVLPLVEQSSLLFGRFLVSLPFFTYGGILADAPEAGVALAASAAELARARRARHVELRHTEPWTDLALPQRTDKVSMLLPLPDSEQALSKQLGSKLRSQIKRAEREEPEIIWGGAELIPQFYEVFATTMHEVGTPVYPPSFFEATCRALEGLLWVVVVRTKGQVGAAAVLVRHGNRIEVPWAAATQAGKRASLNMRLYWELLTHSIRVGAQAFDFGRSSHDSGTYRFKAQWGAQPMQLHWHYWLPVDQKLPQLNQSNPKYALAASLWRRLPLWCANALGPHIVKNLP
jgi:serine/alanine adding enzyme